MAYSTVTGVSSYFGNPSWNASTKPSYSDIENWCDEAAAIIDAYIADVVSTPVTNATDRKILTSISDLYIIDCINFVQGKNRIMMQQGTENVPRSISHKTFYERLDMIKNGTIILISSSLSSKSLVFSGAQNNSLTFIAQKDTIQW